MATTTKAELAAEVQVLRKSLDEERAKRARLEEKLTDALEQQTATSDILRVISRSRGDVQPVFEAIAESAARLIGGVVAGLYEYDGALVHLRALSPPTYPQADQFRSLFPRPLAPDFAAGRVILERTALHVADLLTDPATPPTSRQWAQWLEMRGVLWVPLLRDDTPVGVVSVTRAEPGHFSDEQVNLLQTFAEQAVIAIENARLFTELEARNRNLTEAHARVSEALEQQTATSEILRVIGSSPTDVQPVFETIARAGVSVCRALGCAVFVVDGDLLQVAATHGVRPARMERFREEYPIPLSAEIDSAQTVRARRVFHLADIEHNPSASASDIEYARLAGYQTRLMVPMVRGDRALGLIAVTREAPPRSRINRSTCSRPSPTKRSSPSTMSGCSRNWRPATAS